MDLYINLAATGEMTDSLYNTVRRIAVLHTAIQQKVYIMQIFNSWYAAHVSLKQRQIWVVSRIILASYQEFTETCHSVTSALYLHGHIDATTKNRYRHS